MIISFHNTAVKALKKKWNIVVVIIVKAVIVVVVAVVDVVVVNNAGNTNYSLVTSKLVFLGSLKNDVLISSQNNAVKVAQKKFNLVVTVIVSML